MTKYLLKQKNCNHNKKATIISQQNQLICENWNYILLWWTHVSNKREIRRSYEIVMVYTYVSFLKLFFVETNDI